MKKNAIIINIEDNTATVTKDFMKKSCIFGTEEYKIMRQFRAENPDIHVDVKKISRNSNKTTYKHLTYENIVVFIKTQDNASELLEGFETAKARSGIQSSPYRAVLAWFLKTFPDYDSYKDFFENLGKNKDNDESKVVALDEKKSA